MSFHRHNSPASNEARDTFVNAAAEHTVNGLVTEYNQLTQPGAADQLKVRAVTVTTNDRDSGPLVVPPLNFGAGTGQKFTAANVGSLDFTAAGSASGQIKAEVLALNDTGKRVADRSNTGQDLASTAQSLQGQKLWSQSKYAKDTDHGIYGCAASMSIMMEKAGYKYVDSPTVGGLVNQLERHGWTKHPASEAQKDDVMVAYNSGTNWKNGGGNSHLGLVTANGTVYNNSSRQGETWVAEAPDVAFGKYDSRYVLRPPPR